jgi:hypothetical protein
LNRITNFWHGRTKSFLFEQLTICVERRNEVPFATPKHAAQRNLQSGLRHVPRIRRRSETEEKPPPVAPDRRHPLSCREVFSISPTVVLSLGNLCPDFVEEELFVQITVMLLGNHSKYEVKTVGLIDGKLYKSTGIYRLITVAALSKASTVFARSNVWIVSSNPAQDMDVCVRLFCVCVVLCVGSGLAIGCLPSKESYRLCIGIRN